MVAPTDIPHTQAHFRNKICRLHSYYIFNEHRSTLTPFYNPFVVVAVAAQPTFPQWSIRFLWRRSVSDSSYAPVHRLRLLMCHRGKSVH